MKFRTADLIARIDETVILRTQAAERHNVKAKADREQALKSWTENRMPAFVLFADNIKARARKKQPVVKEDCPKRAIDRWGSGMNFWDDSKIILVAEPRTEELVALRAALSSSPDEFTTTTGLRELGYKDLNALFSDRSTR